MFRSKNLCQFNYLRNIVRFQSNQPSFPIQNFLNEKTKQIDKRLASEIVLNAKQQSKLSFEDLAKTLNVNKVWFTSGILGQHPINEEIAKKLLQTLNINGSNQEIEQMIKNLAKPPEYRAFSDLESKSDPAIRRFQELIDVYGNTFKTLIREEFGDGIMSAIDCTIEFDKRIVNEDEKRVVIKIDGKYLKYKN